MKRTITIDGKSKEYKVRDLSMLDVYAKNPSNVFKNKKAYTRKEKHKIPIYNYM